METLQAATQDELEITVAALKEQHNAELAKAREDKSNELQSKHAVEMSLVLETSLKQQEQKMNNFKIQTIDSLQQQQQVYEDKIINLEKEHEKEIVKKNTLVKNIIGAKKKQDQEKAAALVFQKHWNSRKNYPYFRALLFQGLRWKEKYIKLEEQIVAAHEHEQSLKIRLDAIVVEAETAVKTVKDEKDLLILKQNLCVDKERTKLASVHRDEIQKLTLLHVQQEVKLKAEKEAAINVLKEENLEKDSLLQQHKTALNALQEEKDTLTQQQEQNAVALQLQGDLEKLNVQHQINIENVTREHEAILKDVREEKMTSVMRLQKEMIELTAQHQQQLQHMIVEHKTATRGAEEKKTNFLFTHQMEIQELKMYHSQEIEKQHKENKSNIAKKVENEKATVAALYQEEIKMLQLIHQQEVQMLQLEHQQELGRFKIKGENTHQEELQILNLEYKQKVERHRIESKSAAANTMNEERATIVTRHQEDMKVVKLQYEKKIQKVTELLKEQHDLELKKLKLDMSSQQQLQQKMEEKQQLLLQQHQKQLQTQQTEQQKQHDLLKSKLLSQLNSIEQEKKMWEEQHRCDLQKVLEEHKNTAALVLQQHHQEMENMRTEKTENDALLKWCIKKKQMLFCSFRRN
jgi:hypothetical protein